MRMQTLYIFQSLSIDHVSGIFLGTEDMNMRKK